MGYDRGDSFPLDFEPNGIPFGSKSKGKLLPRSYPFDFEPNGIQFGSKSKGKLSPRPYPIHYERKWKYSFLSVVRLALTRVCCEPIAFNNGRKCFRIATRHSNS